MRMQKNKFRRGFTLTELIAVVIILGVLTALASGSYKKAVERSRAADGLVAATTVMEALDRYYIENFISNPSNSDRPSLHHLDVSFPNQKPCDNDYDYCLETKYFRIELADRFVDAQRKTGDYKIRAYSRVFTNWESGDDGGMYRVYEICKYINNMGQDVCVSAGYTSCVGSTCRKPI